MTFGSLFSGIGGMDLGLERAGMECRWQVEIDPFCRKVLTKHWPEVPKYGDIRELDGSELERVDCIAGGYPCQPFSQAGKRSGADDARHLWPEFARLIRTLRPSYALLENVPGHLSLGFGDVLGDLAGLGYDAEWLCLRAADFGAAHLRKRVFVVAYASSSERRPDDQHNESTGGRKQAPNRPWSAGESLADAGNGQLQEPWRGPQGRDGTGPAGAFAPGPSDARWPSILRERPDLAPALESPLRELADGLPSELVRALTDRTKKLKALGNAVVPQVAEWIGRRIMEADA